jgi:acyl-CoA synthetase (AMP-forming)/AMP-acid ligase II
VKGKSQLHQTTKHDHFMNWTGLDHVAGLIEIHIHALSLAANQYHIPGQTITTDPMTFLQKLHEHKVSYTFAPNFFLALLVHELLSNSNKSTILDLASLRAFISGGESNVVETCVKLTSLLQEHGAPASFLRPGFGMTETCAGSIYSLDCPVYDISRKGEFACLGHCIPGMEMRIVEEDGMEVEPGKLGELQVRGNVVFDQYCNDIHASHQSWTGDGWFRTGDRGFLDSNRRLHLTGRDKDTAIING